MTFYDDDSGERVELSVTTYANWVAKTASLLVEEHDLERGDRLRIDLPAHWLGPVFLGAAWPRDWWSATRRPGEPTPSCAGRTRSRPGPPRAEELPVLACSLRPLGVRFAEPLPAGVHDVGVEVWSPARLVRGLGPAAAGGPGRGLGRPHLHPGGAVELGRRRANLTDGGRLLTEANPASPPGLAAFTEPLARGGSLVLVVHAGPSQLAATYTAERATARFPA